jgi:hypothetical protein
MPMGHCFRREDRVIADNREGIPDTDAHGLGPCLRLSGWLALIELSRIVRPSHARVGLNSWPEELNRGRREVVWLWPVPSPSSVKSPRHRVAVVGRA